MIKKILKLLSICCVVASINAVDGDQGQENIRKPKASQEAITAKSLVVVSSTVACLILDVATLDKNAILKTLKPGFSRMVSSASVMFHDAMEGPLVNKQWVTIIDNGFCVLAIIAMPEVAIGTYAGAYTLDWLASRYQLDPINKSFLKYWGGRIGGILSQLVVPAVFSYFSTINDEMYLLQYF